MPAPDILAILAGLVVGVSLGLTGGGGSIFAVPLLVYVLHLAPGVAIGLSLAMVGLTAGFGAGLRLGKGEIDWQAGWVFAAAGMLVAPAGAWLGRRLPPAVLLSAFAILMLVVGIRMWRRRPAGGTTPGACFPGGGRPGWACYGRLAAAGTAAGVLSGLFGVGGGFIIVPALLYVTGMGVHRAIATSLLVILLISLAGVAGSLTPGHDWPWRLAGFFMVGGLGGMAGGSAIRNRLPPRQLQQVFAIAMWLVAVFMLAKNVPSLIAAGR
ncbi:MAG: sulfite exporter TauE/SafE family protein [Verrucomicrobiales bacterium]